MSCAFEVWSRIVEALYEAEHPAKYRRIASERLQGNSLAKPPPPIAMASNLMEMACNLIGMASNLLVMACNLIGTASKQPMLHIPAARTVPQDCVISSDQANAMTKAQKLWRRDSLIYLCVQIEHSNSGLCRFILFPKTVYCRDSLLGKRLLATLAGHAPELCVRVLSSSCPAVVL